METQKNDEKNIVLELKRQLGRMMVQVDYLYRNDREMSRLDHDILMERTRELYDLLCDYNVWANHQSPVDEIVEDEPIKIEINEGGEFVDEPEIHEPEQIDETPVEAADETPDETPNDIVDETSDEEPLGADEDSPSDEIMDKTSDEPVAEDDDEDWDDDEDQMFRVEKKEETVPEPEDNSLAARLQRSHVSDIRLAMGINDKVMIINELFMGSVERYNKSIDALNDFPTLSGARVYMSELQIELQWDTDSQAYRMLNDLVERRFI